MKKLLLVAMVATLAMPAFAAEIVSPITADSIRVSTSADRTIPVYDPLDIGAISYPNLWDADQFDTIAPETGFTIDGFSFGWGELIVFETEPITYGTVTVAMFDWVAGDVIAEVENGVPKGVFTFDIQTQYYPGFEGQYFVYDADYVIPDPLDYVTFASDKIWFTYVFSHIAGEFTLAHADDDLTGDIGTNMDNPAWWGLDPADLLWHNYWFGGVPNGDLYGDLNMVPEPASLLLIGLGALLLRRR